MFLVQSLCFDEFCSGDMASAAKANKLTDRDSGYGRDFVQKKKRGGGSNDVNEKCVDKSKEKIKWYKSKSIQNLPWSCPKNQAEIVFLCLGFISF